ncbi:unnamed protein product, partial [Rotaria sordida]
NDVKHDETGNVTTIDSDHNDTRQSADSIELLPMDEHDTNQIDRRESLAFKTPCFSQEEDINQFEDNESTLKQDEIKPEEQINSSDQYEIEENTKDNFISSPGYYGNLNDSTYLNHEKLNKQSLVDVEEVDSTSSRKLEENKSQN